MRRERQPLGVIVGLTTYFEWRIYEALYGREAMMLLAALLQREMERDFLRFHTEGNPQYTALASYVPGSVDPDDTFSRVPYCKGALFITALEQAVGREKFDAFLLAYIKTHRFTSIDTATFLDFVAKELPGALEATQAWRWVYEAGLPANCPKLESPLIDEVARYAEAKQIPPEEVGNKWIAMQWVLYLELLERPIKSAFAYAIDHDYGLSTAANTDVRWAYLLLALEAGYLDVNDAVEKLVSEVGRMKYILPIYKAMAKTPNGVAWARRVFNAVKAGYHPIATAQVERILGEAERAP
ncbi:MAG: leukotriene A4 hydrolase C-terminal domain-containing protein [Candidatus Magasanikbacteria bacterium]|nr:leukotriene A4 hydrolase C-terminal domain-containing protein [Candidatus Magasanikbacteria bacterium]